MKDNFLIPILMGLIASWIILWVKALIKTIKFMRTVVNKEPNVPFKKHLITGIIMFILLASGAFIKK
jgi:hypothetical protein